ncbi:hypothetical protein RSAG8_06294, partial [Rhizoctonia solani AG-8 WAC10335]
MIWVAGPGNVYIRQRAGLCLLAFLGGVPRAEHDFGGFIREVEVYVSMKHSLRESSPLPPVFHHARTYPLSVESHYKAHVPDNSLAVSF